MLFHADRGRRTLPIACIQQPTTKAGVNGEHDRYGDERLDTRECAFLR